MRKLTVSLLLLFMMVFPVAVFAQDQQADVNTQAQNLYEQSANSVSGLTINQNGTVNVPHVTPEQAGNLIIRKMAQIIVLLQKLAWPLAIIFIIIGFFVMMFAIFNLRMVWVGIMIIFVELVAYVGIMYSPIIIDMFYNWMRI
ncbi:hypothetical protein MHLNE_08950 [Moorella humiferrea]|uniref:hypothetical protein n=1 Tax=Neomoorella humiferrea TaxID=676965 RepID=UPI0030CB646B